MEKQLQIFNNPDFGDIRVIEIDNEPWLVGKDAAIALGYSNPRDALSKHVPDKFKRVSQIATPSGAQNMTLINEAGLYKLIMRSKLPNAEKFSDWCCGEVLPSIRKHGAYVLPQASTNPHAMITLLRNAADTIEKLQTQVNELKPHAEYCRLILRTPDAIPVTVIAKDYGMCAAEFNELLHKLGIQYKVDKTWVLYSQYTGKNYTASRTTLLGEFKSVVHTYWTQKGRLFLYEKLKKNGTLPICEQAHQIALPL